MPNFSISPLSSHATANSSHINNVRDQQHQSNNDSLWADMKEWFHQAHQDHAEALLRDFYQPAENASQRERLLDFIQLKLLLSPGYQHNLSTEHMLNSGQTTCTIASNNGTLVSVMLALNEDDHQAEKGLTAIDRWLCDSPHKEVDSRHNAAGIIWNCWRNNSTSLGLSDLGLTTLPDPLPQNLQTLNVNNNSLTMLPDTRPQSLKTLNVKNNPLTTQRRELTMTSERRSSYTFKPYQRRPGARDIRQ